jgi:hypothetical protein
MYPRSGATGEHPRACQHHSELRAESPGSMSTKPGPEAADERGRQLRVAWQHRQLSSRGALVARTDHTPFSATSAGPTPRPASTNDSTSIRRCATTSTSAHIGASAAEPRGPRQDFRRRIQPACAHGTRVQRHLTDEVLQLLFPGMKPSTIRGKMSQWSREEERKTVLTCFNKDTLCPYSRPRSHPRRTRLCRDHQPRLKVSRSQASLHPVPYITATLVWKLEVARVWVTRDSIATLSRAHLQCVLSQLRSLPWRSLRLKQTRNILARPTASPRAGYRSLSAAYSLRRTTHTVKPAFAHSSTPSELSTVIDECITQITESGS